MAGAVSVRLERKAKLYAKLRRLVPSVEEAIDQAAGKSAGEMAAIAKSLAPQRTGNLAAAVYAQRVTGGLGVVWRRSGTGAGGSQKFARGTSENPSWKVAVDQGKGPTGHDAYYGFWVENATVDTAAQPFFFPAYRLVKKRHRSRVTRAINKEIKALART